MLVLYEIAGKGLWGWVVIRGKQKFILWVGWMLSEVNRTMCVMHVATWNDSENIFDIVSVLSINVVTAVEVELFLDNVSYEVR